MNNSLVKEIQLAVLALAYQPVGNSIRGDLVHIDHVREWVEARNPNRWTAESITREVRRMKAGGLLEGKDGMYKIRRG